MHLVAVIPPKYTVSAIVGKLKANTSREIHQRFPWVKKRYVEFQEKVDKGQLTLQLDFGFGSPVPRAQARGYLRRSVSPLGTLQGHFFTQAPLSVWIQRPGLARSRQRSAKVF